MSEYKPINKSKAPQFKDTIISVKKIPFTAAPALSFLSAESEKVTASSVYYDGLNPNLSTALNVNYVVERSLTTLAEDPLLLRHNGSTVDMEIYVDTYGLVQEKPYIAPYTPNPAIPRLQSGDRYERSTMAYIYKDIPVPPASTRIWDGRYQKCVDADGNEVDSRNYLPEVRAEVAEILSTVNSPYTVAMVGGYGHTVYPPTYDPYEATYRAEMGEFIAKFYSSSGLPDRPTGKVHSDIYIDPGLGPNGEKPIFKGGFVAALLEDRVFVKWVNVYRYEIPAPEDPVLDTLTDCHTIIGTDSDGDSIISISFVSKNPPDPEPPLVFPDTATFSFSLGYLDKGDYTYTQFLPDNLSAYLTEQFSKWEMTRYREGLDRNGLTIGFTVKELVLGEAVTLFVNSQQLKSDTVFEMPYADSVSTTVKVAAPTNAYSVIEVNWVINP